MFSLTDTEADLKVTSALGQTACTAVYITGIFTVHCALVTPVLKKPQLDPSVPNNYRPVSNLSFVSKLLERVVARQLTTYLNTAGLIPANTIQQRLQC